MKAKRIVSVFVVVLLMLNLSVVYAAESNSSDLENIISIVKQKAGIDDTLEEFNINTISEDGNKTYNLTWNDEYKCEYVSVICDNNGRISDYNHYGVQSIIDEARDITYADAVEFTDNFMHNLAPELFENENDCLIREDCDEKDASNTFVITYNRMYNGIRVEDNVAAVEVCSFDDKLYISNAYIDYDYDASFEGEFTPIENYQEAYIKAFPIELIYRDINRSYLRRNENDIKTALLYRCKDNKYGYILASDGSVVEKDEEASPYIPKNEEFALDESGAMASSSNGGSLLSEEELAEIKNMAGLIDENKAIEIVKQIPGIKIDDELKMTYSSIRKVNENYYISVNLCKDDNNDYSYISLCLDAMTGKLIHYNCSYNYDNKKDASESEIENANIKIDEFLSYVIPKESKELTESYVSTEKNLITKKYDRVVNDVRYVDDGIYIEYDATEQKIVNYNYDFEENIIFDKPEPIIGAEEAYKAMVKVNPIELRYVKTDGVYKPCYTLNEKFLEINAFTGEKFDLTTEYSTKCDYKDIEGHWAEDAIRGLAEKGIVLNDEYFSPDDEICQEELLRLFAAGTWYADYINYDSQQLYGRVIRNGIIKKGEISATSKVKREDAFKYLIRMNGLEKIAALHGIFKVDYADGNEVSDELLGYAAILSGMNVISGDGGYLRPNDNLTRAEAATLLYNYMNREL